MLRFGSKPRKEGCCSHDQPVSRQGHEVSEPRAEAASDEQHAQDVVGRGSPKRVGEQQHRSGDHSVAAVQNRETSYQSMSSGVLRLDAKQARPPVFAQNHTDARKYCGILRHCGALEGINEFTNRSFSFPHPFFTVCATELSHSQSTNGRYQNVLTTGI